jgi:CheY-like chemotaxis protein
MAKILIIEDDSFLAEQLQWLFIDNGHTCKVLASDDDVIDNWQALPDYDTVVLDLMIPRSTRRRVEEGSEEYETGEIIFTKLRSEYPDKRVVVVTALPERDIHINPHGSPEVGLLRKPFGEEEIDDLLEIVNR